ncbi:hypothetical protein MKW98_004079, partial [Papaver atlanticum]
SSLISKELAPFGARSISTQIVRNRMKSVKNIQKITKAMKMVAASKLRAIQVKAENSRGLWQPFTALLGDSSTADVKKNVIVTVSFDKGLCGGIYSTSVKVSKVLIKNQNTLLHKNPLNYTQVSVLADDILKNVEYDALRIIVEREAASGGLLGALDSYEIEGGDTKAEVLMNLTEFQFSCVGSSRSSLNLSFLRTLFNAVLENPCSEQGAQVSAMDSSSRNAGYILQQLLSNCAEVVVNFLKMQEN